MDKGTELGNRVQRDSSSVKLAPNVGLEASKGPMGGNKGRNRTYDRYFKSFGLRKSFVKAFLDLEIFRKVLVVGPFLAHAVQEPLAVGHNQW